MAQRDSGGSCKVPRGWGGGFGGESEHWQDPELCQRCPAGTEAEEGSSRRRGHAQRGARTPPSDLRVVLAKRFPLPS